MKNYKAPWCTALHVVSWTTTAICLIAVVAGANVLRRPGMGNLAFWLALLPLTIVMIGALFTVRGYIITPDAIIVKRLFWQSVLPHMGLDSATVDPHALQWALRTFGIGGLYSFSGFYWNKRLRHFCAYVTDPRRCVVLRYRNRTAVVSPDDPRAFVSDLQITPSTGRP